MRSGYVSSRGKWPGKTGLLERREPSRRQREQLVLDQGGRVWGLIMFTEGAKQKRVTQSVVYR